MAAAAALGPAHQLEEEVPLVLARPRARRLPLAVALEQRRRSGMSPGESSSSAEGVLAVAAGAADLLVVGLDRARRGQVDDRAHVGPVDAHAEGVGRDDDLELAGGEGALHARRADAPRQARVVGGRRASPRGPAARPPPRSPAGRGVDDGRRRARRRARASASASAASTARAPARARHLGDPQRRGWGGRSRARAAACRRASPRRSRISSRTTGVAVAVQASTRASGSSRAASPICRYSGRKSWPHSLMQWASSTATSGQSRSAQQRAEAGEGEPLGRHVDELEVPARHRRHAAPHLARRRGWRPGRWPATPRASSAATWSCISEISGEMTSVVPGSSVAGSW